MKKNKIKDIVFLLDRSGSMYSFVDDTIGGYNSYLEKERKNNRGCRLRKGYCSMGGRGRKQFQFQNL